MSSLIFNGKNMILLFIFLVVCCANTILAQTTAFTYQGKLNDGGNAANGSFQMEFKLFDALVDGNQIGSTITNSSVAAAQGVFTVSLDFGANAFTGADRFLEISVKRNAGDAFTVLAPRQQILSAPFAIKSKSSDTAVTATSADQLDGLPANRFVQFDANGDVSIGTTSTGSKLTVAGVIESTTGGIKFPDATTQTTAGLTAVTTNATLTGDGTTKLPLGIASPLLVRDIDNPAFQPFVASRSSSGILVTVPAGKRLVVEFVTAQQVIPVSNVSPGSIQLNVGLATYFVAASSVRPTANSSNWHTISQSTRIYVPAGQALTVSFESSSTSNFVSVSGYYVDIP